MHGIISGIQKRLRTWRRVKDNNDVNKSVAPPETSFRHPVSADRNLLILASLLECIPNAWSNNISLKHDKMQFNTNLKKAQMRCPSINAIRALFDIIPLSNNPGLM